MKVILTHKARRNLLDLFEYNSDIRKNYATRIDKRIHLSIKELEQYPYIGRFVPEMSNPHYIERICEGFRIIYFISEETQTIYIRYIISAKQDKTAFLELHQDEIPGILNNILTINLIFEYPKKFS